MIDCSPASFCDTPREATRRNRSRGTGIAGCLVLATIAGLAGCSLWRGELDPQMQRRLEDRLHRVTTARLNPAARSGPVTLADALSKSAATSSGSATSRPATSATSSVSLALADVRRLVLQNNLDLQIQVLQPDIARTLISEETARFDATIGIGASYSKKDLPAGLGEPYQISDKSSLGEKALKGLSDVQQGVIGATADALGLKSSAKSSPADLNGRIITLNDIEQQKRNIGSNIGIGMLLPTGAQVRANQSFDRLEKLSPFSGDQDSAAMRFSVSQPLLRSAGPNANLASIRIARLNTHAETAKLRLFMIRLLATAEKAYWQFETARRIVEIRQRLLGVAESNLDIARKRAGEGLIAPIETIRAEVGAALQREALIVAETQARIQERELKRILNMPGVEVDSKTALDPVTQPQLTFYELDSAILSSEAVGNRIEMLELELALAADEVRIGYARNQILPSISLDFDYGLLDRAGSPGSAWRDAWDFDTGDYAFGIKGEIPVTNELRKAQLRRARLSRAQRLATRAARELAIRQEVLDALDLLNQNWQRIIAARQTVIAAGKTYEAELRQFDQGGRTMREVYESLAQLGDAQAREAQAVLAYQVSLVDVAFATGTLMGHARVDFEGVAKRSPLPRKPVAESSDPRFTTRVFSNQYE